MKKFLLVAIMALSAGQAFARVVNQVRVLPPKICPSWGCSGVPLATLAREQVRLSHAVQAKLAAQARLGGGGCFELDGRTECL